SSLVAFRGNAVTLNDLFSTFYAANPINITANDFNQVDEKVWAIYGQLTWKGEIAGRAAGLVFGARYEETRVRSLGRQATPTAV
ncbi:MAG: hypothetical protein G3W67_26315, partial [Xanthomonas perforans]|nr:hypothetical protein [Xanthomonas perforans]